jgi:hypothetical protein
LGFIHLLLDTSNALSFELFTVFLDATLNAILAPTTV